MLCRPVALLSLSVFIGNSGVDSLQRLSRITFCKDAPAIELQNNLFHCRKSIKLHLKRARTISFSLKQERRFLRLARVITRRAQDYILTNAPFHWASVILGDVYGVIVKELLLKWEICPLASVTPKRCDEGICTSEGTWTLGRKDWRAPAAVIYRRFINFLCFIAFNASSV